MSEVTIANKVAPIVSKHGKIAIVPIVGIPLTPRCVFHDRSSSLSSIIAAVNSNYGNCGVGDSDVRHRAELLRGGVGTIVITDQGTKENIKYIWDTLRANGMSEYASGIMGK